MDKLSQEYGDRAKIAKIDIDSNKFVGTRFGLKSIPAVIFFQEGELKETLVGVKPYETFSETLEGYLS